MTGRASPSRGSACRTGTRPTLITALRDAGPVRLTVYCNGLGQPGFPTAHLLADNHQIGHLVTCFSARPGVVSEAEKQIQAGEMTLEMVPQGTLVERMRAGGAGIPAFYTPTGYGSEIAEGKDIRYFDGRPYVLERAITTDFALIRAQRADHSGNLAFRGGSRNFNVSFAKAARVTIVEAEEVVSTGKIAPEDVDPKLVEKCEFPVTAPGCVDVIVTDLALLRRPSRADRFVLEEVAAGLTVDEVLSLTGMTVTVADRVRVMQESWI